MSDALETLVDGLGFLEGPRWHDERLWFSDFQSRKVYAVDVTGGLSEIVAVPGIPSGLGWLPDGSLLVVSQEDRRLLRLLGEELAEHADLSPFADHECNDMVVDESGRAYVGQFGFDYHGGATPQPTVLLMVAPNGGVTVAAEELMFPNGTVITPDGRTLIVAESFGARMTAFDVADDGSLSGRRIFAELPIGAVPDGCCLDADGHVWVALPMTSEVVRLRDGGEVVQRISTGDRTPLACMLGGAGRQTLYICAMLFTRAEGPGAILTTQVDVPGAGFP